MNEGDWWTAPTENEDGSQVIMVTGRRDVKKYRENPRYRIRVEVTWKYEPLADGMPSEADARMMEKVQDALQASFLADPVAVLTGVYTGDGERDWVFYTTSVHIFGRKLNEALADLPLLPLTIYTENDPDWAEYDEMSQAEINLD